MTDPIQKPDENRSRGAWRCVVLACGIAAVFAATVLIMLRVLPGTHTHSDYMIAGTLATCISLLLLFGVLMSSSLKSSGPLVTRRQVSPPPTEPPHTSPEN